MDTAGPVLFPLNQGILSPAPDSWSILGLGPLRPGTRTWRTPVAKRQPGPVLLIQGTPHPVVWTTGHNLIYCYIPQVLLSFLQRLPQGIRPPALLNRVSHLVPGSPGLRLFVSNLGWHRCCTKSTPSTLPSCVPVAPAREEALPPAGPSCVPCTLVNDSEIVLYSTDYSIFLIASEDRLGNCSAKVLLVTAIPASTMFVSTVAKRTFTS